MKRRRVIRYNWRLGVWQRVSVLYDFTDVQIDFALQTFPGNNC